MFTWIELISGFGDEPRLLAADIAIHWPQPGPLWREVLQPPLLDLFGPLGGSGELRNALAGTVGPIAAVALVTALYEVGVRGAASINTRIAEADIRGAFMHSLVPIAVAYVVAHYLTYLLFQGQAIAGLASDPLGRGWDLLGTAGAGIDYRVIGRETAWYAQVLAVVVGHVTALVLAHDRALALYTQARDAVRSQYWMLGVMAAYTLLALWLLSQANV